MATVGALVRSPGRNCLEPHHVVLRPAFKLIARSRGRIRGRGAGGVRWSLWVVRSFRVDQNNLFHFHLAAGWPGARILADARDILDLSESHSRSGRQTVSQVT